MCGIAGFISANKAYDGQQIVRAMLEVMRNRGPDARGIETYDQTVLGMNRLCIIGKEQHTIPYEDETGRYAIVYNGEIYNNNDLKSELARRHHFKTNSDAETALYGYIERGVKFFDEINGMYAFALIDTVERETLVVRDKAGEKPLYYTQGHDYIAFSSEIKGLLTLVGPRINHEAISYKAYEFTVGRETLFKDIYVLEPGEYLRIKDGRLSVHSYWKVWERKIEVKDDEKSILRDLGDLIEDAILLRKQNCVHNTAVLVSGGVDSALVACIAKPNLIYTVHYEFPDFDELEYAKAVAQKIGTELRVIIPNKEDFINRREVLAHALETPCTWTSFSLWMLIENIKRDDSTTKVVMTGDGADELFGGYFRYCLLYHDEQIHNFDSMKRYNFLIDKYYGSKVDRYRKLVNRYENIHNEAVNDYLNEHIGFYFSKMNGDILHSMGVNDFYTTMQVLLKMSDSISMNFSIENRSPFLDHRLIQYAFSMPSKYKIRGGITKWALKRVAARFIPKSIVERMDKRGFSAPLNRWFGWDAPGCYNRSAYRRLAFDDWKKGFKLV